MYFVCKHTHLFEMMCHLYFSRYKWFNYKYAHIMNQMYFIWIKIFDFIFSSCPVNKATLRVGWRLLVVALAAPSTRKVWRQSSFSRNASERTTFLCVHTAIGLDKTWLPVTTRWVYWIVVYFFVNLIDRKYCGVVKYIVFVEYINSISQRYAFNRQILK